MAQYSNLKAYIEEKIYENGTQAITGDILQDVLKVMTDDLGEFYQTGGVASPATDPGTPDAKVIYIATEAGTYTNFGNIELAAGEVALLIFDTSWVKETLNVLSSANGGVKTANLADGAVTTAKIANGAVGEGKIADASVTSGKLGSGAVTTEKIADGAATTDKIANKAVATGKLGDKAVTSGKIADSAVGTTQVANEAITEGKIADEAVTAGKIADGAVTNGKINDGAVTEGKIGSGAVTTGKIGAKAVTTGKIADKAVTTGQLGDKAVTSDKIADGAVGSDQLAEGAFSAQNLADGSVTTDKLADDAVTAEKIADGAVTANKFANGSVTTIKLGSGAVTTEKIGDGMVTRQKLADSSVGTSKIINGAVTGAKLQEGVRPVINVNALNEETSAYGSAALARAAVPSALRILGLHIIYLLAGGWFEDEYIGSDVSGWGTASNWRAVGPVSVSQNTLTGKIELLIGDTPMLIVDNEPELDSVNLVKSGGVFNSLIKNYAPTSVTIPSSNKGKYISIGNIGSTVDITPITQKGFEYIIIAVKAGDCVSVKGDGAGSPRLWAFTDSNYVLLRKSEDDAHVENPVILQATTDGYFISNGKTYTGYIEHIVYIYQSLSDVKSIFDDKIEENALSDYKTKLDVFNGGIKIGLAAEFDTSGYDGDGVWAQIGNNEYLHRLLFVKSGSTIVITTGSSKATQYALMDLNSKPENNKNITYVDGVTRTTLSYNSNVTITPTKDCYLYLLEKYQSQPYGLPQVSIDGVNPFASLEQKPKGILIYDAQAKKFNFYSHRKDDEYYGFTVELVIDNTPIVYKYLWELTVGELYQYNGQTFTKIADTIDAPENEMAIHFKGKGDYTGGYHGDERIDVSPDSFVKFFADGKELSTDSSFAMYCNSFSYIEYSTLHETTNDGTTPIEGHPIVAYHTKRAIFENCSHIVENCIEMVGTQIVDQAHAGLICISKGAAIYAFLPNNVLTPQLTGTNQLYNASDKALSSVDMWNTNNNIKVLVDGVFLQGFNNDEDIATFAVWDRITDSKYYRRTGSDKTFTNGQVISNRQTTKFY